MNYALASLVAFILFGMGAIALIFGARNYIENKKSKTDTQMFFVCVCVFLWDFGYAWMSMCYDTEFAYVPRAIALLAVNLYVLFIIKYVAAIVDYPNKKLNIIATVLFIFAMIPWTQISWKRCGYIYYDTLGILVLQ